MSLLVLSKCLGNNFINHVCNGISGTSDTIAFNVSMQKAAQEQQNATQ
jgi:hypothetical protein